MTVRLLFDVRWFDPEAPSGIGRYTEGLVGELRRRDEVELTLLTSSAEQRRHFGGVTTLAWCAPTSPRELLTGARLRRHRFDAVWSPHFVFGGAGLSTPLVLSVLDLIPFHHPMGGRPLWRLFFASPRFLRLLLRPAAGVATLNAALEPELRRYTSKPILVVAGAPSPLPPATARPTADLRRLVYMGRYDRYKDVETLIRAMPLLPGYELVLLGSIAPDRRAALSALVPDGCRVTISGPVSDQDYADALAGATALVTASREEGFGLPVVEAMAAGTPVVCSRTPVFEEVAGTAASYFPPGDAAGLAAAVRALEDEDHRHTMVQAGSAQAQRYGWGRSVDALLRFVSELIPPAGPAGTTNPDPPRGFRYVPSMRRDVRLHERDFGRGELLAREIVKVALNTRGERRQILRARAFDLLHRITPHASASDGQVTYLLNTADHMVARATFAARGFDMGIMEAAIEACEREGHPIAGRVFVDIGANVGITALPALARFNASQVVAFEPGPENLRLLHANLALNGLADRVVVHPVALGREPGTASLGLSTSNWGDHRIRDEDEGREVVEVPVETLDSFVASGALDPSEVGLVWMDVQGFEGRVLEGGRSVLDAGVPLVTEYWPKEIAGLGDYDSYKASVLAHFDRALELRSGAWHRGPELEQLLDRLHAKGWVTDLLLLPPKPSPG